MTADTEAPPTEEAGAAAARSWREHLPDPHATMALFRRNLLLFFTVFFAFTGAVAAWIYTRTPIYAATSAVLVEPRGETVVDIKSVSPDLAPTTDLVDTEVRLIRSPQIANRVADAFAAKYPSARPKTPDERAKLAANLLATITAQRVGATYVIEITSRATHGDQATEIANLFANETVNDNRDAKRNANSNASGWLRSRVRGAGGCRDPR